MQSALQQNKKLKVFSLDYWYPEDSKMIAQIYSVETDNGFSPYVATIDLDKIVKGPEVDKKKP